MTSEQTAIELLERWLRQSASGHWRDTAGLSLDAAPVADDTRAFIDEQRSAVG